MSLRSQLRFFVILGCSLSDVYAHGQETTPWHFKLTASSYDTQSQAAAQDLNLRGTRGDTVIPPKNHGAEK